MSNGGRWNVSSVRVDRPFCWPGCGDAPSLLLGVPGSLLEDVVVVTSPSASSRITPRILLMILLTADSFGWASVSLCPTVWTLWMSDIVSLALNFLITSFSK